MTKTYVGSCHCGAVHFECDLDIAQGTSRCNCSICGKTRFWKAVVGADAFRLTQGESVLTDYRFGSETIAHLFCSRCGVKPFGHGYIEGFGDFYAINLACLDSASDTALAVAPVRFEDGRHDMNDSPPAETRHL